MEREELKEFLERHAETQVVQQNENHCHYTKNSITTICTLDPTKKFVSMESRTTYTGRNQTELMHKFIEENNKNKWGVYFLGEAGVTYRSVICVPNFDARWDLIRKLVEVHANPHLFAFVN